MHACILSTGYGRRLGGIVTSKALIPFLGRPLVAHTLELLDRWGVEAATLLARSGQDLGVLRSAVEGAVLPCTPVHADDWVGVFAWLNAWATDADEPMLIVNGDLLLSPGWGLVSTTHYDAGADLTIGAIRAPGGDGQYGKQRTFAVGTDGMLVPPGSGGAPLIAHQIGMSVVAPRALRQLCGLPLAAEDPWSDEFVPRLLANRCRIQPALCDAYWRDVGTWRRIWAAHADHFPNHVDRSARVHTSARLEGWTWIGPGAVIASSARIENSVVEGGAVVGPHASVKQSFIGAKAFVPAYAVLDLEVLHCGRTAEAIVEELGA